MAVPSVAIVGVYFGKLPSCFPVWLESCRRNSSIDFFIVTDQAVEINDVSNVKIINMSMKELKEMISKKMGFDVNLENPFKVCDFKPTYGFIFEDLIPPCDYWGHCDFDLIWGDIRSFLTEYELEKYDKFLPLGHLTLYRNTPENNRRFMENSGKLSDYKTIFQKDQNYLFDELAINEIYRGKYPFFEKIIFADIWPWRSRYTLCTDLKYYRSIYKEQAERLGRINFKNQVFVWADGKVYQLFKKGKEINEREYMYIHIQKRNWSLQGTFSDFMVISQNCVKSVDKSIDIDELIKQYNSYRFVRELYQDLAEFVNHCWRYFKRRIIKIEASKIIVEKK